MISKLRKKYKLECQIEVHNAAMIISNLCNINPGITSSSNTAATFNQLKGECPKETTLAKRKYIDYAITTFRNEVATRYLSEKK